MNNQDIRNVLAKDPKAFQKEIKKELARRNLLDFILYTKKNYEVNWHHELICKEITDFINDPNRTRLMVWTPPRKGKSEIISRRLAPWVLGNFPNTEIIGTSYSADLASAMTRDVTRVMDSDEYLELFPEVRLSGKGVENADRYKKTTSQLDVVGFTGRYKSAGVDGPLTGSGADLCIIDDPYKDWQSANSAKVRETVWSWYNSVIVTRLSAKGKVIIVHTRWHEDDLCGKLLQEAKADPEADQWEVICLPEVQDDSNEYRHDNDPRNNGEVLWPTRFPADKVAKTRASIGAKIFSALYQQRPTTAGGNIFSQNSFKYFYHLPEKIDYYMASWDCNFKEGEKNDFVVGTVWAVAGTKRYLVDFVRERMGFTKTIKAMLKFAIKWDLKYQVVEDAANGPAVINVLKDKIVGLVAFNPNGSKIARANAVQPQFEAGQIFLPDKYNPENRQKYPEVIKALDDIISELKSFPNGANDDIVDSITQALLKIGGKTDWMQELIDQAKTQEAAAEKGTTKVIAEIMGWQLQDPELDIDLTDSVFDLPD